MALDVDVLAEIRVHTGSAPPDADVEAVYVRRQNAGVADDKIVASTALAILKQRRAEFTIRGSFAVPGEYSQSVGEAVKALDEEIAELEAETGEGAGGVTVAKMTRCDVGR